MQHPSIEKAFIDADYLLQNDQPQAAALALNKFLTVNPKEPNALYMMGVALAHANLSAPAAAVLQLCVAAQPDFWQAWNNLGNCFQEQHPQQARAFYKKAHDIAPDAWEPLSNLANSTCALGRYAEAVDFAKQAIKLNPSSQDAHNAMGLALLHLGRWDRAWRYYARSYGNRWRKRRDYTAGPTELWTPNVASKDDMVVIHGEQGPGDEFMFATLLRRALDHAESVGAKVAIEVNPKTETLFRATFGDHPAVVGVWGTRLENIITWHEQLPRPITHKLPFGSLPLHFQKTEGTGPHHEKPYLEVPLEYEKMGDAYVRAFGRHGRKMRVGLAWNGGSVETGWYFRSLNEDEVRHICLSCPDIDFFSLEYGVRPPEDIPNLHDAALHRHNDDLALAAGIILALDHVASVTTTVVDLAGALGKRATVLAPRKPDWRYAESAGEDKMHWYSQHHIIRQKEDASWENEIKRLIEHLNKMAALRG